MHGLRSSPWRLVIRTLSPFLHYIVCAFVNDYNANEEWCVAGSGLERETEDPDAFGGGKKGGAEREREMEERTAKLLEEERNRNDNTNRGLYELIVVRFSCAQSCT